MNDDPSEVDVVYGRIHCEPLQSMAEYIVNQFIDTGFMPRQFDRIKLHVTLMNTKFRLKDADEEESIPESSKYFQFHEKIFLDFENHDFFLNFQEINPERLWMSERCLNNLVIMILVVKWL